MYFYITDNSYEEITVDQGGWPPTALIRIPKFEKTNSRYTKWVSKYSSYSVGPEKYHIIQITPAGSHITGCNRQF